MNRSCTDRKKQQSPAMLSAREQWWYAMSAKGDPLSQVNIFDAFEAGYEAAVKRMKEAT